MFLATCTLYQFVLPDAYSRIQEVHVHAASPALPTSQQAKTMRRNIRGETPLHIASIKVSLYRQGFIQYKEKPYDQYYMKYTTNTSIHSASP